MFHSFRSLLLSFFVLAAQPIAFAHADQLTVEDPGDSGKPTQLRALIDQAKDGDVIVIPGGMTVKIQIDGVEDQNQSGDFDLNKNIQITGAGAQVSAIEGDAQSRIFDIADGKTVSLSDLTLRNGTSTTGGAIRNKGGTLNLDSVHLTQNSAPQGDGGALYQVKGITNIAASSFTANEAKNGGALYVAAGNVHLENSTLGKNSATDLGGGAIVINGAVLNVNYATISKNSAAEGGGIWGGGTLQNSIVSENTGTVGKADIRSANGVDSRGNNLVGDVTDGIFTKAGDSVGADVQLLALSEDEALPFFPVDALSPAKDAAEDANCPSEDIRGVSRPQGAHCDIGSFEVQVSDAQNPGTGNGNGDPVDAGNTSSGGGCELAKTVSAGSPSMAFFMMSALFAALLVRSRKKIKDR